MLTLTTLFCALLSNPAAAADHEVSVELGLLGTQDDRFDLIRDTGAIRTWGFRGAVALTDNLAIVAGYHRGAWGSTVEVEDGQDYPNFQAAYKAHHITLGPKLDVRANDMWRPYATVQGALLIGRVMLDDDTDHDDNINQLSATGMSPGGAAALGFEMTPLRPQDAVRLGLHFELGYGLAAASGFGATPPGGGEKIEIARFGFGGVFMRTGVGVHF